MTISLVACSAHPHFKNSGDALKGCNKELHKLQKEKKCSIKELAKLTNEWLEIQDSAFVAFSKDSTMTLQSPYAVTFFTVSDSIRNNLARLALNEDRSLRDVMFLKLNTSKVRDKTIKSNAYKEFEKLYAKMDENRTLPNTAMAVTSYIKLVDGTRQFKNESDIKDYIVEEDICFRTLMKDLSSVPNEQLNYLTRKTNLLFDNLYNVIGRHNDDVNDRMMLLLTMRVNRRVIQNCMACREDILNQKKLDKQQRANYRWMLIQPFMTIDDFSAATMTKEQQETLLKISDELPELINRIDESPSNQNVRNLSKVLAEYFLKNYITNL